MTYETILTAQEGPTLVVTLNRPQKRNAISLRMMEEITTALSGASTDASVRTVIITGGTEFFAAGADLNEAMEVSTPTQGLAYLEHWHRMLAAIEENAKPVIAAIEGFCITGGLEIALACDLRVAADDSTFAITSSKIGTIAGAGGTMRLPRIVGMSNAMDILFSADPIDAGEAYRMGLINRKCKKGTALETARKMADVYAQRAPLSLQFVKRAVHRGMQMDLASALEFGTLQTISIYGTNDKNEGISAFLQKRTPAFKGN
jgi:enoyl-CoA hydratase/carnithine racemase